MKLLSQIVDPKAMKTLLNLKLFPYIHQAPAPSSRMSGSNGPRNLNLTGHVGFDSLPDQLVNKSVAQGFCFNILCLGKHFYINIP